MLLRDSAEGGGCALRLNPRARAAAAVGSCRAASTPGQLRPWARGLAPRRAGAAPRGGRALGSRGRDGADRIVRGFGSRQQARTRTRSRSEPEGRRRQQPGGSGPPKPERAATAARSAQSGQPALAAHQRAHAKGDAVRSTRRAAGGAQALPAPSVCSPAAPPALPLPPSTRGPRPAPGGPRVLLPRQS